MGLSKIMEPIITSLKSLLVTGYIKSWSSEQCDPRNFFTDGRNFTVFKL
jgi:hypothetical protein